MNEEREQLYGDWWIYRHGISNRHMLNDHETKLTIEPPGNEEDATCLGSFQLGKPLKVTMVADPTTNAWYGMDGSGSLHFRWSLTMHGRKAFLVGQVFDERAPGELRDFFVAVRSQRTISLPQQSQSFHFAECHLTPFMRQKLSAWTNVSILLNEKKILVGDSITYTIGEDSIKPHEGGGLALTGWRTDAASGRRESLELWLLPSDETGFLLATGCHSHWDSHARQVEKRPLDPTCVNGAHLCL